MSKKMFVTLMIALVFVLTIAVPVVYAAVKPAPAHPGQSQVVAKTPAEHTEAAEHEKKMATYHKGMAEHHKSMAAEHKKLKHHKLAKHHEAIARCHTTLSKEHAAMAKTHEEHAKGKIK